MTRPASPIPATQLFSTDHLLRMDETVREIFGTMLGMEVSANTPSSPHPCGEHTASIGFGGVISGHCKINLNRKEPLRRRLI